MLNKRQFKEAAAVRLFVSQRNATSIYLVLDAGEVAEHHDKGSRARRGGVEVPQHGPLLCQILVVRVHLNGDHRVSGVAREGRNLQGRRDGGGGEGTFAQLV